MPGRAEALGGWGELAREREMGDKIRKAGGPHHIGFSKLLLHGIYLNSTIIHYFFNF